MENIIALLHSYVLGIYILNDPKNCHTLSNMKIRAVNKGRNPQHLLLLSMFDGPLMLRVNWPVVDTIHPQSNKFATGVKIKATGEWKLNNSPENVFFLN